MNESNDYVVRAFNIRRDQEEELIRRAGQQQAESGSKVSVSEVLRDLLDIAFVSALQEA